MAHTNTLALVEHHFTEHPEIAALFGSYDDNPLHRNWVSLYKNLQHHFVHHQSHWRLQLLEQALAPYAGCSSSLVDLRRAMHGRQLKILNWAFG